VIRRIEKGMLDQLRGIVQWPSYFEIVYTVENDLTGTLPIEPFSPAILLVLGTYLWPTAGTCKMPPELGEGQSWAVLQGGRS